MNDFTILSYPDVAPDRTKAVERSETLNFEP
jgi:hypothetical protein